MPNETLAARRATARPPLTVLSDEELAFRDAVAEFAQGEVKPRVAEMEKALASNFSADAVSGIKVPAAGLSSDLHGSAEYRAAMIPVMAARAVAAAAAR